MKTKIQNMIKKHKEIIIYGIVGCFTTLLNIAVFYLFNRLIGISLIPSNAIAWIGAFLFSFFTTRKYVFPQRTQKSNAIKEMLNFLWTRLATMFLDTILMWVLAEKLLFDKMTSKVIVNIIVIILNYITSKFYVFRKG